MQSKANRQSNHFALKNGCPTIAVMAGSMASFYQTSIHLGATDYAKRVGYNTITFAGGAIKHPDATQFSRSRIFDLVEPQHLDGLIIPLSSHSRYIDAIERREFLDQFAGIPIVNIDGGIDGITTVFSDYATGMRDLVRHLVAVHGLKRFAFFSGPATHASSKVRFEAFREVLAQHGLTFDEAHLIISDMSRRSGAASAAQYLQDRKLAVDAIIAVNDMMALGIIDTLMQNGIRVPHDVVVTGSMGLDEGLFNAPPLTTIREPMYELGWHAAQSVISLIEGRDVAPRIEVPTRMLIRASCGCSIAQSEQYNVESHHLIRQNSKLTQGLSATEFADTLGEHMLHAAANQGRQMHASLDVSEVSTLANSLYAGLQVKLLDAFFSLLNDTLLAHTKSEDITAWIATLAVMQDAAQVALSDPREEDLQRATERRFVALRDMVNAQQISFRSFETEKYINLSREISDALNSSFNLNVVKTLLLRDMGVQDCYISLYADKKNIRFSATTILAIQHRKTLALPAQGNEFPTTELLPAWVPPYSDPISVMVLPLWFRAESIGFVMINADARRGMLYENLQSLLSGALKTEIQIQQLTEAEQRFSDIAHSTSDWLWEVDAECHFTFCSGGVLDAIGYSADEILGRSLFDFVLPTQGDYLDMVKAALIPGREAFRNIESVNRHRQGHDVNLLISGIPIFKEGQCVGYRGLFKDVTEIKQKENKIRQLAYSDALTGLPNRTLFNDRLDQTLANARRDQTTFAVFFLDLDRFKYVNDTLGHDAGDQLLKTVAKRLQDCIREVDTLARLGGDEFTIVLNRISEPDFTAVIARRVVAALNQPFEIKGQRVFVSTSVGVALFPQDGLDAASLLKNADKAMYRAKEQGKNRFVFFDESTDQHNVRRMQLESSLRHALEHDGFSLVYQPLVDTLTGQIHGVEALLRLNTPDLGAVTPTEFIPLAEELGLIEQIGEWVFATACKQARIWQDQGHGLRMSINVSGRQFKNPDLAQIFLGIVERTGVHPTSIEVEITENTVIENQVVARSTLLALQAAGLSVALDDFGTGFSSLSVLNTFPINTVKIDRSFMTEASTSDDGSMVKAIIYMSKILGMNVVAEGVETIGQLNFLRTQDCDLIQGYLFSRPVPGETIQALLAHNKVLVASGEVGKESGVVS